MAIRPLDKKTADALCTIVTIGFIQEQMGIKDEYMKTMFTYEIPETHEELYATVKEHEELRLRIQRDSELDIGYARIPVSFDFPFVISKSSTEDHTPEGIVSQAFNQSRAFWNRLEILTFPTAVRPKGAYIGGMAQNGDFTIYGPSNLMTYNPEFRIDTQKDYLDLATEIVKAYSILTETEQVQHPHIEYIMTDLADADHLNDNKLFGCIHGMVNAMLHNPNPQNDQILIEYSLGLGTTKVASCIPCSIFMSANGMPASATHFGRGDYWNFPQNKNNELSVKWHKKIYTCFLCGREALSAIMNTNPNLRIYADIENSGLGDLPFNEENLSRLFLESLTFPGKFTAKVINTLQ